MSNIEHQLSQLLQSSDLKIARDTADSLNLSMLVNIRLLALCAAVYRRDHNLPKAAQFSSKAMFLQPDNLALNLVYASDLFKLGQFDASNAVLDKIPAIHQHNVSVLLQRAKILYQQQDFDAAERLLSTVIQKHPNIASAHMELAHTLLMQGKWQAGWEEYEWRYRLPKTQHMLPKFKMPHWDGNQNTPHILLIADQGYGDCFQFSRYFPLVAQRCSRITLMRSQPLARLMDASQWISEGHSKWEDTPMASAYCTLSGLPRLLATTPGNIPECDGVIQADEENMARWKKRLLAAGKHPKLKIGMVWSGRTEFEENNLRAIPFEKLEKLLDIPGVEFFSLQVGSPATQAKNKNITDLSAELTDFAETAAAIKALDLIITTDTSVAHLAGALGQPAWVLLSYAPDWRWGAKGDFSAWYPSLQLYRQDKTRNWQPVINECHAKLLSIANTEDPLMTLMSTMQRQ